MRKAVHEAEVAKCYVDEQLKMLAEKNERTQGQKRTQGEKNTDSKAS